MQVTAIAVLLFTAGLALSLFGVTAWVRSALSAEVSRRNNQALDEVVALIERDPRYVDRIVAAELDPTTESATKRPSLETVTSGMEIDLYVDAQSWHTDTGTADTSPDHDGTSDETTLPSTPVSATPNDPDGSGGPDAGASPNRDDAVPDSAATTLLDGTLTTVDGSAEETNETAGVVRIRVVGDVGQAGNEHAAVMETTQQYASIERDLTITVRSSLAEVEHSVRVVRRALLVLFSVLVAAVGGATWYLVGRALAPVDRLTQRVKILSPANLSERVPVPPTDDEIAELAVTMNNMLKRIEAGSTRERQFLSNVSHELRSPLATMRARLESAAAHPQRIDQAEVVRNTLDQVVRLEKLVSDQFALSRLLESNGHLIAPVEVDLDDIAMEAGQHRGDSRIDLSGIGAARVTGDPVLLSTALRNLIDNATRHANNKISVSVRTEGDQAVIAVDDDGNGVPEDERVTVFDRFVRLQEARSRDEGGAGLGLALVKEVATAHGGNVEVLDSVLGGARFQISVPLVAPDTDEDCDDEAWTDEDS